MRYQKWKIKMRNAAQSSCECGTNCSHESEGCMFWPRLQRRGKQISGPSRYLGVDTLSRLNLLLLSSLLIWLDQAMAAPQSSCILCDKEDLRPREPIFNDKYEEFTFDHQVSRQDAIQALRKFNESHGGTQSACNTMKCTTDVLRYCLGEEFIKDHCWCDLQHREEGLPYAPHICYVGEKVYKPSVGSCFFFEELKECCCAAALVKEWRHISGASVTQVNTMLSVLLGVISSLQCWWSKC